MKISCRLRPQFARLRGTLARVLAFAALFIGFSVQGSARTEEIWHPPVSHPPIYHPAEANPPIHHPAVTHVEHHEAVYLHHDAVNEHHDAIYQHHDAVVVHHDADVVHHDAVVTHHDAATHTEYDEDGNPFEVEDSPAWDEETSPAWDEEISPAWDEEISPGWDEEISPAWDQEISPAWDELISPETNETIIDADAYDEPVPDTPDWWEPVPDTPGYTEYIEWTESTIINDVPMTDWAPHTDTVATDEEFLQTRTVLRLHENWESSPGRESQLVSVESGEMEVVQLAVGTGIWSDFDDIINVEAVSEWSPYADTIPAGQQFEQARTVNRTHRKGQRHTSGEERNVSIEPEDGAVQTRNEEGTGVPPPTTPPPTPPITPPITPPTTPPPGSSVVTPPLPAGSKSFWRDVDGDGILDEIISANDPRVGLVMTVEQGGWEADLDNDWFLGTTRDGDRVFSSFSWSLETFIVPPSNDPWAWIDVVFAPEPGREYIVWADDQYSYNNNAGLWPASVINAQPRRGSADLSNGSITLTVPSQRTFLSILHKMTWYLIRLGKPSESGAPSNLKLQGDEGSIFASWTNPGGSNFASAVVAWSSQGDVNAALSDPGRHIETANGFHSIEGLSNGVPYNVWVFARGTSGVLSSGFLLGAVVPSVPIGYGFKPNADAAAAVVEQVAPIEGNIIIHERQVLQKSTEIGPSWRSILAGLNAALTTAITPIVYTARVHDAARHIAVRIVREAYLNGEITAEQYVQIAEYIINSLGLPPVGMAQGEAEHNVKLASDAAKARVSEARTANESNERSPGVIYRFGGSPTNLDPDIRKPSRARPQDFKFPAGSPGSIIVTFGSLPELNGASACGDVNKSPLTRHYWKLPAGAVLPPGIGIISDGYDVMPGSFRHQTHHTIYPKVPMTLDLFNDLMRTLPVWTYGGFKP